MFVEQQLKIPRVTTLRVDDLLLRDARALRDEKYSDDQLRPIRDAWKHLQTYVTDERPGSLICMNDSSVQDDYDKAFDHHRRSFPRVTTDEFDQLYQPEYDDASVDPRLGALTFTVSQQDFGFGGLFHLYNIRIDGEEGDDANCNITASPSPSFATSRGFLDPDDQGRLLKALLERDVPILEGGGMLDLVEWTFPTRADHAWRERPGSLAQRSLAYLKDHDREDVLGGGDPAPKRIRRRASR